MDVGWRQKVSCAAQTKIERLALWRKCRAHAPTGPVSLDPTLRDGWKGSQLSKPDIAFFAQTVSTKMRDHLWTSVEMAKRGRS